MSSQANLLSKSFFALVTFILKFVRVRFTVILHGTFPLEAKNKNRSKSISNYDSISHLPQTADIAFMRPMVRMHGHVSKKSSSLCETHPTELASEFPYR